MIKNIAVIHVNQFIFVIKIAKYNLGRTINKSARPFQPEQHRQEEVFNRESCNTNLSTKQKYKVTGLIGDTCLIKVLLNNKLSSVLLNTTVRVPGISDKYLRENFHYADEYPINTLLDRPDLSRVQWGNQTDILFSKYTIVSFSIWEGEDKCHLDVPFLITTN